MRRASIIVLKNGKMFNLIEVIDNLQLNASDLFILMWFF